MPAGRFLCGRSDLTRAFCTNGGHKSITLDDWDQMMHVILKGLFFCCRAASPVMLPAGHGRILDMSSQAGSAGIRDHAVYCPSEWGVEGLARAMALEWSAGGWTAQ